MKNLRLDHATINTANLEKSVAFYRHFLNLQPGWRPDFGFEGAWLYPEDGDYPIVHLIERPSLEGTGMFNHIAFRGDDLQAYLAKVKQAGCWFEARSVFDTPYTQVHHFDPNDVRIEVLFEEPLGVDLISSKQLGITPSGRSVLE